MHDKGYPYPLYSLDLLGPAEALPEGPKHAIEVPQGRLVVRPALRRQGADTSSPVCEAALREALSYHRLAARGFSGYGFSEAWRENMRHWGGRMRDLEAERARAEVRAGQAVRARRALLLRGTRVWRQLALSAQLGGLDVLPLRRLPRKGLGEIAAMLGQAARRAAEPTLAEALARSGFSALHLCELLEVARALPEALAAERDAAADGARATALISVVRGALIGDLLRLCQVAAEVLPQGMYEALTMRRLLRHGRRR